MNLVSFDQTTEVRKLTAIASLTLLPLSGVCGGALFHGGAQVYESAQKNSASR